MDRINLDEIEQSLNNSPISRDFENFEISILDSYNKYEGTSRMEAIKISKDKYTMILNSNNRISFRSIDPNFDSSRNFNS